MAPYRLKPDPSTLHVDAVQWFKDGDHPAVSKIYGAGTRIDEACGHPSNAHGLLTNTEGTHGVCPGDWIVSNEHGARRYRPDEFAALYEPRV